VNGAHLSETSCLVKRDIFRHLLPYKGKRLSQSERKCEFLVRANESRSFYLRIEPRFTPRDMRESRKRHRVECDLTRTRYYSKAYVTLRDQSNDQSNGIQCIGDQSAINRH